MRYRSLQAGVCCGLVTALAAAGLARAQSEGQPAVPPVAGTETKLEEIVVTAERRVADIEKTSISVTAVSGDALLRENAVKLDDAIAAVPAVHIVGGPAGFLVRIRGEGLNIPPTYGDPSVPVMLDGMYNTQVTTTFYGFYDVARVEVLRGPQGTLFGKNSTGGVVNIITNNPVQSEAGLASVAVGNYDTVNTQFMYNAPLTDDLALRVAGSTAHHRGFLSNGDSGLGSQSARVKLSYAPNQVFSLLLGAELSNNDSAPPGSVVAFGTSCCSANSAHGSSDPWYDPAPGGNYWRAKYRRYWADAEFDFGWATLSVLPSLQTFDISWRSNFAPGGSVADYQASTGAYQVGSQNQYAGEIHLTSPDSGRVRWVAGVYYYNTPDWVTATNNLISATGAPQLPALYPNDTTYTYEDEKIRDIAGFAQAAISLTHSVRLIAGARETSSRKSVYYVNNPAANTPGEGYLTPWNASLSTTQFTYKAGFEEDLNEDSMLYQQVSTGFVAGGFNFNNDSTFKPETLTAFEIGSKNRLLQDTLQINAEIFDNEIHDAQTFYQLQNPFLNGTTIIAPVTVSQVEPARARSYGGELEMQYLFTAKDRLDFSASYLHARFIHFNDACLAYGGSNTSGACAGVWPPIPGLTHVGYDGGQLPQSPTWTLTAAYQHTFTLQGGASVTAHVDTRYFTRNYLVFNYKDPFPPFPTDTNVVPAATVSNASLDFETSNGRWTFEGWIHNMENTPLKTGSFGPNLQLADPRTYGLSVWARF